MLAKSLAVILLMVSCAMGQDHRMEYHRVNVPGALETALSTSSQPAVRHEVGSLKPPETFTVFAVIAGDRAAKHEVKGLEVQVEGIDIANGNKECRRTAYIDEAALPEFERRLTVLVKLENANGMHSESISIAEAANKPSADPKPGVYYDALVVGSYWKSEHYGLYVDAPYDRATRTGSCQFKMPQADVRDVLTLIQNGSAWLSKGR